MPNVLVSGAPERVAAVSEVLREHDCTVVGVDDLEHVPAAVAEAGADAFDAYVQLPAAFTVEGGTAVARVNHLFTCGVMARFPAIDAAVPALKPNARVTLVMWELPPEVATQDDVDARQALMRVLAHAAQADAGDDELSVRVLGSKSTPEEIALAALGKDVTPDDAVASSCWVSSRSSSSSVAASCSATALQEAAVAWSAPSAHDPPSLLHPGYWNTLS